MGNFQSYLVGQDDGQPLDAIDAGGSQTLAIQSGVHTITINGSEAVSSTSGVTSFDTGKDFTPYAQEDWRSTARTSYGSPTNDIDGGTVVRIGGVSAKVSNFLQTGILIKQGDGYVLAGGEDQQPRGAQHEQQQDQEQGQHDPDLAVMPEEVVSGIDQAAAGIPQVAIQNGMASAIAGAMGDIPMENIATGLAQNTGMELAEAQGRAQFIIDAYQAQADSFLTSQVGLSSGELEDFYDFAREPGNKDALRVALEGQLYGNSMAGWRPLIGRYMDQVAPSAEALQTRGFETRVSPEGEQMVRIQGVWMSTRAAARAGLI
ncbi:hypothetical protein [Bordetella bronchiseptica]|uniref:hypothetical protein n=1 Tax=Bordetella bronchiseptica TaxID=518 RepID=UPI0005287FB0|nr:hypothetical protein [Bordetella bronchiseptica]